MKEAIPLFALIALLIGGAVAQPQDRFDSCMEVVRVQGELIEAQLRLIDSLQRQLDECLAKLPAQPPVDPPGRPPTPDPPPADTLTCEQLAERVQRVVQRDLNGTWRVRNDGDWTTHQTPTTAGEDGTWNVSFHGDPSFPASPASNTLSLGAYRSAGLTHNNRGKTYDGFVVQPNAMQQGTVFRDGVDQFGKEKWGFMSYNDLETHWLNGWLNGGGTSNRISATKEHSYYGKVEGDVEYGWLYIEDWGGQGLQIVSRPWTQGNENAPFVDGDTLHFHDICMHENGRNLGRASFPLTIAFNRQTDASDNFAPHTANIVIEDVHIRSTQYFGDKWSNGNEIHAKGGILVRGSESDPNGWTFASVAIQRVVFALDNSDRAIMQLRNIENVLVLDLDTDDVTGNRKVDLHKVGMLSWDGNPRTAGVAIRYCHRPYNQTHSWQTVGDGAEDFVLVNGVRQ